MKTIIFLGICISAVVVAAVPVNVSTSEFYHESFGIRNAAKIKEAEEQENFVGSRIVGGSAARLGEHPYMGGLVITLSENVTSVCGSTLLSHTRAVTAAHCWFDGRHQALQFVVVLGSLTLFRGGSRIVTNQVVTHPNYDPSRRGLPNNVAIVTLPYVSFTDNIGPIALASGTGDEYEFVGEHAWAVGYGKTSDASIISPNQTLHRAEMQVIVNALCIWSYGNGVILQSNVCARPGAWNLTMATCAGDYGGPLVYLKKGTPELVGIASFGPPESTAGCEREIPVVFSRVTSFYSWIKSQL